MIVALLLLMDNISQSINLLLEDKRIERIVFLPELLFRCIINRWMLEHALVRRLRDLLVLPDISGSHALFVADVEISA